MNGGRMRDVLAWYRERLVPRMGADERNKWLTWSRKEQEALALDEYLRWGNDDDDKRQG